MTPPKTIAFSSKTAKHLGGLWRVDRTNEEGRKSKRERRAASGTAVGDGSRSGSVSFGTPVSNALGLIGERAPDVDPKKNVSKKEQKRQADAKHVEAQQHARTNDATSMALGFGKKLSWMQKDTTSGSSGGFPVAQRANTVSKPQGITSTGTGGAGATGRSIQAASKWEDFREDKEAGFGIQMRDVVFVLEPEPKEKKSLAKAYIKLGSRN